MYCYESSLKSSPSPISLLVPSRAIPLIHASRICLKGCVLICILTLLCLCTIDTLSVPKYLKWLVGRITSLGGRVLRDHRVGSLQEVVDRYQCDIVINCTGLGAGQLNDVRDSNMHTIRGQTVLVDAPHIKKQYYRDGKDDTMVDQ